MDNRQNNYGKQQRVAGPGVKKSTSFSSHTSTKKSVDHVKMIVLATVAETVHKVLRGTLSLFDIEDIVKRAAVDYGAKGELLAALLRHLPKLYAEVRSVNFRASEAFVLLPAKLQYEIWTQGEHKIVDDISKYEKKKRDYLFWVDLDEKKHESSINPSNTIRSEAVNLLIYLVERLGRRTSAVDVLRDVFKELKKEGQLDTHERNKIEQQLTALEKFCGGQFRKYLFPDKFNRGLGLQKSFSKEYFIFARLC